MKQWHKFDPAKGSRQKRPPERKYVLCRLEGCDTMPGGIVVGYRKDGAGDKQSPYFVTPGGRRFPGQRVLEWCDCLPEDFVFLSDDPHIATLQKPINDRKRG